MQLTYISCFDTTTAMFRPSSMVQFNSVWHRWDILELIPQAKSGDGIVCLLIVPLTTFENGKKKSILYQSEMNRTAWWKRPEVPTMKFWYTHLKTMLLLLELHYIS